MIEFVEFDREFLDLSWEWLNDPEIKYQTLTPDFTKEDQIKYFESLPNKKDYKVYGIILGKEKIGVVGFKNIKLNEAEYFGYIGDKNYCGKGIGKIILDKALNLARSMGFSRIYLKVGKNNIRALKLYKLFNFSEIKSENEKLWMELNLDEDN